MLALLLAAASCQTCHAQIYKAWQQTGMARSFSKPGEVPALDRFYHEPSRRYYRVLRESGTFYLRRHQIGFGGAEASVVQKSIDVAVGSGAHARSYLHRAEDGRLKELPLTWYAERGGYWAMSPGFDRADHQDFRRQVSEECLFCHAGDRQGNPIDCRRCHGPGDAHQAAPGRDNIINPARLAPERQMDICMQCHLQTTSRLLPHALRRYERAPFSYTPGEPLSDYVLHFDHPPGKGYDDKFEVNGSAYRFRQSRCLLRSGGRLTCITCHDPHQAVQSAEHYRQVCRSCHAATHKPERADCTGCHMPKRRAEDAVHVIVTDHRIQRAPPAEPLGAWAESTSVYQGEVRAYYPSPADPLYLALAQVADASNLKEGVHQLAQALAHAQPVRPEFYYALGEAYGKLGDSDAALRAYRRAGPGRAQARIGEILLRKGDTGAARRQLEEALASDPRDADALNTLGVAYGQLGNIEASLRALRRAVKLDSDFALAWLNLGVSLEQTSDWPAAQAAYRGAIRVQPDFGRAHAHLAALLEARGNREEARYERALAGR